MGKSTNFFGQPVYGQLIKSLDRAKIVEGKYGNSLDDWLEAMGGNVCFEAGKRM